MLVCPHCQSENQDHNSFCQSCGTSLTHQSCHRCGAIVPFSADRCPQCRAWTGTVWQAIVAGSGDLPEALAGAGGYLDPGRRYRLLSSQPVGTASPASWEGTVADGDPLRKTSLAQLLESNGAGSQDGIPELARPYLRLQDWSSTLPEVHDAWQQGEWQVLLLAAADAAGWQPLSQVLTQGPLSASQAGDWLGQAAALWEALSQAGCCQSLLLETNLWVDEHQVLRLKRLYPDLPQQPPLLSQWLKSWQQWLGASLPGGAAQLLERAIASQIPTVTALRQELEELARIPPDSLGEDDRPTVVPADASFGLLCLEEAGYTDRGRKRPDNEDYFAISSQVEIHPSPTGKQLRARGLYLVCDGMGGHERGAVASAMAAELLQQYFKIYWSERLPDRPTLERGLSSANQVLYDLNQVNARCGRRRMGTTLAMALIQDTQVALAHLGDSRIYRVTQARGLEQLTTDHDLGQQAIQQGVDPKLAYALPHARRLFQALGPYDSSHLQPQIQFLELREDTLLLLCSDGLSDYQFVERRWQSHLLPLLSFSHNLDAGLRRLIALANREGGHDNLTGILVRVQVQCQSADPP